MNPTNIASVRSLLHLLQLGDIDADQLSLHRELYYIGPRRVRSRWTCWPNR